MKKVGESMATPSMDLWVCAEARVLPEANKFISKLGARAKSTSIENPQHLDRARYLLVYLDGSEPASEVKSFFRTVRNKRYEWMLLYTSERSLEGAAKVGKLVGEALPARTHIVFDTNVIAHWLNARNEFVHGIQKKTSPQFDSASFRKLLDLTQEQVAAALNVTPRTIQNWETQIGISQVERKTRDLREFAALMHDYVVPGKEAEWLRTPSPAFKGRRPVELLTEGKVRDLIVEFRRLQDGQPI